MDLEVLDTEALRAYVGSTGPWATDAGAKVRRRRTDRGWSDTQLGAMAGVTSQTIRDIEAGRLIPREYLRCAIAFALSCDVEDLWPPLTQRRIGEIAAVA